MDDLTSKLALVLLGTVILTTLITTLAFYRLQNQEVYVPVSDNKAEGKLSIYINNPEPQESMPRVSAPQSGHVAIRIAE